EGPLLLAEPLAGLQLQLGVTVQRTHFYGPLLRLTGAYLLIALLIVAGAIWAVRIVVPPLVARLSALTRQANAIAEGGMAEFKADETEADEIGQLSHAFAQMVRRLNAANESLERTVQERTAELRASESYNKALFANSYIPMVVMDPASDVFIDCNDAAVEIYRLGGRHQVLGKTVLDVSPPTQYDGSPSAAAAARHVAKAREQGLQVFEWRHRRADGQEWDAEVRLMSLRVGGKELLQFSLRDITAQKLAEADIWRRANFDILTGLANRNLLRERLERAIADARRSSLKLGVLFLDLDGFKAVNDTLGHGAGDELLIEAARRLERCVREQDTAARLGGDEFVLLIHHLDGPEDLARVATAALASLNQPFLIAGNSRQISTSIGIAVYPDDAETADALLDLADRALYQAKKQGKNRYRFHKPALD
ncbi:MAG TPA: diguanylate cyclase, partial [Rhodocyclaceae bacterium]|nr:diguanylate cyclase [Rhodocyclaceae bacterium]